VISQGSAHGRFQRAIENKNLFMADMAAKELRGPLSLIDALSYIGLVAEVKPERVERLAIRWHGRFELQDAGLMTFAESQLALSALAHLSDDSEAMKRLLKRLLRKTNPTLVR
jgi:hypothetical protein